MSRHASRTVIPLLIALALGAPCATAHRVKIFATVEGDTISGYAYVPGGGRVVEAAVRAVGPKGERLGSTTTDANGEFELVPTVRCPHTLTVETADGHAAEWLVEADELPQSLPVPAAGVTAAPAPAELAHSIPAEPASASSDELVSIVEKAVAKHIRPLREEIDSMRSETRLHDVLGGIGYILGLTGIVFYLKARRLRDRPAATDP